MTKHTLPPLPYPFDALEPYIDAKTMEVHYTKHHQTYLNNLNTALEKAPQLSDVPIQNLLSDLASVPEQIREAVRNNGGGHFNHSIFWTLMGKNRGGDPLGEFSKVINKEFGSWDALKEKFKAAALGRFGSGWAWVSLDKKAKLLVHATPNQDSPVSEGLKPIFGLDVWEHAYYLKYQNRRADYIDAWWNVIDWETINERYINALHK